MLNKVTFVRNQIYTFPLQNSTHVAMFKENQQLIETIILLVSFFILSQLLKLLVKKFARLKSINPNRRKLIFNLFNFISYLVLIIVLAIIWGVDVKQFTVFMSSIFAILGIALFAQWSILSNLTASVILFFNHPLRIGDRIKILDNEFDWTGEVKDITGFYLFMETDKGENITIPNSIVIQKGIEILKN